MITGIGIDVLEIARMSRLLEKPEVMSRVFTENEREYIASKGTGAAQSAAGIFCAKEAYAKATGKGLGTIGLLNIEIMKNENGAPYICLRRGGVMEKAESCFLSVSHTDNTAAAVVVMEI